MRSLPPPRRTRKRNWRRFKRFVRLFFTKTYWRPELQKSNRVMSMNRPGFISTTWQGARMMGSMARTRSTVIFGLVWTGICEVKRKRLWILCCNGYFDLVSPWNGILFVFNWLSVPYWLLIGSGRGNRKSFGLWWRVFSHLGYIIWIVPTSFIRIAFCHLPSYFTLFIPSRSSLFSRVPWLCLLFHCLFFL